VNALPLLSRRNLRIKVMQVLFANSESGLEAYPSLHKLVLQRIRDAGRSYLYHFAMLTWVSDRVEQEALMRSSKYLPTDKDLSFSRRFYRNAVVEALRGDAELRKLLSREAISVSTDDDIIKLCYNQLKELDAYREYLQTDPDDWQADRRMALDFFEQVVWISDDANQHFEYLFPTWDEDVDMIVPRVQHGLRHWEPGQTAPWSGRILELPEESTQFVADLLRLSLDKAREMEELMTPRLENWELDRVSLMDRTLLRMALVELLFFPTIPIKVSINEYIDISKQYSTPRSKDFINGILDKLMKELRESGRIHKVGRGLVE
jgi:transcription antitermination protein NusB